MHFLVRYLPNILTIIRLMMAICVVFLYWKYGIIAFEIIFPLFIVAATTDHFDGYLARKNGVISDFGRCFDIIADKILVFATFLVLVVAGVLHYGFMFIIFFREFYVSGLREVYSAKGVVIPASVLAKWKTGFQMIFCGFACAQNAPTLVGLLNKIPFFYIISDRIVSISNILLFITIALTITTAIQYSAVFFNRSYEQS